MSCHVKLLQLAPLTSQPLMSRCGNGCNVIVHGLWTNSQF